MDGVVDVYMPDFKLWTRETSRRYLERPDYAEVARESVKEMHRQVGDLVLDERGLARRGVILRHLVMPGLLDETEAILRFVAEQLGTGCYVNLMGQYYVWARSRRTTSTRGLPRGIHREEYDRALELAEELGLRLDARSVGDRYQLAGPADRARRRQDSHGPIAAVALRTTVAYHRSPRWSDERTENCTGQQELEVCWEAARAVPTVVEELVSSRTQEREDVLEVRGRARRCAERRRIERSTPHGKEGETSQATADLEPTRADVLVRDAVADKMEDRSREDRRDP